MTTQHRADFEYLLDVLSHDPDGPPSPKAASALDAVAQSRAIGSPQKLWLVSYLKGLGWDRSDLEVFAHSLLRNPRASDASAVAAELVGRVSPRDAGYEAPLASDSRPPDEQFAECPFGREAQSYFSGALGYSTDFIEFIAKLDGYIAATIFSAIPKTAVAQVDIGGKQTLYIQTIHYSRLPLTAFELIADPRRWREALLLGQVYRSVKFEEHAPVPIPAQLGTGTGVEGVVTEKLDLWEPMTIDLNMMCFTATESLGCTYSLSKSGDHNKNTDYVEVDEGYVLVEKLGSIVCCTTLKAVSFTRAHPPEEWIPSAWSIALAIASVSDLSTDWAGTSRTQPQLADLSTGPEAELSPDQPSSVVDLLTNSASESAAHLLDMISRAQSGSYDLGSLQADLSQCSARGWNLATSLAQGWNQGRAEAASGPNKEPLITLSTGYDGKRRPSSYRSNLKILVNLEDPTHVLIPTFTMLGSKHDTIGADRVTLEGDGVMLDPDVDTTGADNHTVTIPAGTKNLTIVVDIGEPSLLHSTPRPNNGIYWGELRRSSKRGTSAEGKPLTHTIMPAW